MLAIRIGVTPNEFWGLTPFLFGLYVDAHIEREDEKARRDKWRVWHGEALTRMKKIPRFEAFLGSKKVKRGVDEKAILSGMKKYQKRRDEIKGKGEE